MVWIIVPHSELPPAVQRGDADVAMAAIERQSTKHCLKSRDQQEHDFETQRPVTAPHLTSPRGRSHRVVGIVKMGAASLAPVCTNVNRNMRDDNRCFEGMSPSSIENQ